MSDLGPLERISSSEVDTSDEEATLDALLNVLFNHFAVTHCDSSRDDMPRHRAFLREFFKVSAVVAIPPQLPRRRRLPDERESITHKFQIANHEGYLTVGLFDDGSPGEVFVKMAKEGSTLSGLIDGWAIAVSIGLQYGVPMAALVNKYADMAFEPSGFTQHPVVHHAKSILDYIARWISWRFPAACRPTPSGS
jgi:hypothetical protein